MTGKSDWDLRSLRRLRFDILGGEKFRRPVEVRKPRLMGEVVTGGDRCQNTEGNGRRSNRSSNDSQFESGVLQLNAGSTLLELMIVISIIIILVHRSPVPENDHACARDCPETTCSRCDPY